MKCTLCSSNLTNNINDQFYDCNICSALVKDKKFYLSAEEEKIRYEAHNNDVNDVGYQKFTSPITNYILENYLPKHKGLDFGSGTGPVISSELHKKQYSIVQYDPFFAPDKNTLNNKFDYILSCEVFEHFYNPKEEIEMLISKLNKNGVLLIMTLLYNENIDFKSWFYKNDPTHVFIYRKETIEFIARTYNLKIEILTDRFIALKLV